MSRNCRLHPDARSTDTIAPPLVVAIIAPYSAMLIITYAETFPLPALSPE